MKKRAENVDIAKGIAILLVVFGHTWTVLHASPKLFNIIFSFHVPAFFLLSGLFFQPSQPFGAMLASRADGLLKPYLASLLPFALLAAIVTTLPFYLPLIAVAYGSGALIFDQPQWFLPCMFCVFLVAHGFVRVTRLQHQKLYVQLGMLVLLLVAGVYLMRYVRTLPLPFGMTLPFKARSQSLPGLPFSLDIVPVAMSFFLLGLVLKRQIMSFGGSWLMLAMSGTLFAALHTFFDVSMDLNVRRYDHVVLSTLEALAGITILLCVASLLVKTGWIKAGLVYLGQNTLLILLFHTPVHYIFFKMGTSIAPQLQFLWDMLAFVLTMLLMVGIVRIVGRTRWLSAVLLPRRAAPTAAAAEVRTP